MNLYTWNAQEYEKNSNNQKLWGIELISKLNLKENEKILDLGCGDGKISVELARRASNGYVIGVDSSSQMIELARKRYSSGNFKNLSFMVSNASNLTFENEFDIVFSNAVLHWIKDHIPVLYGVNRSLKEKGKILFQMGGEGNASEILDGLSILIKNEKWAKYFYNFESPYGFYNPAQYEEWLAQTGFKVIHTELIPKDMIHENPSALAGWIRTTWLPYTEKIPSNERDLFIDELVRLYINKNPLDEKGRAHIKMVRLQVEAEKINS
jgi:trans-aconitate methyltransferase